MKKLLSILLLFANTYVFAQTETLQVRCDYVTRLSLLYEYKFNNMYAKLLPLVQSNNMSETEMTDLLQELTYYFVKLAHEKLPNGKKDYEECVKLNIFHETKSEQFLVYKFNLKLLTIFMQQR